MVQPSAAAQRSAVMLNALAFVSQLLGLLITLYISFQVKEGGLIGMTPEFAQGELLPFGIITMLLFFTSVVFLAIALSYSRIAGFIISFGFSLVGLFLLMAFFAFLFYIANQ